MLAAIGRSELLLHIACRHGSRNRNEQRLSANFRSNLLQHLCHGLGLYRQQNDVGAFHRFAIVGGYGDDSGQSESHFDSSIRRSPKRGETENFRVMFVH